MEENMFPENPSDYNAITTLSIKNSKITFEEFLNALDKYPHLIEVDISFNKITDEEVFQLVAKLKGKNLPRIRSLDLSSNAITDLGAQALATLSLSSLNLSGNHRLTNQGIDYFLQNHSLVSLDVGGNQLIDSKKKYQIKEKLHNNIDRKKTDFLKEVIQLSYVAKKKPVFFGPSMTLPLTIIFKYLAADIKLFVNQSPLRSEHQIVSVAEFIYNKSIQGKLEAEHIKKAKLFLNNKIQFEEVFKKDSRHDCQCVLM
ncbi:hypothetical protein [Legionella wadsworthii]|nr:hypothetical protein [Legionella wadsworthii]